MRRDKELNVRDQRRRKAGQPPATPPAIKLAVLQRASEVGDARACAEHDVKLNTLRSWRRRGVQASVVAEATPGTDWAEMRLETAVGMSRQVRKGMKRLDRLLAEGKTLDCRNLTTSLGTLLDKIDGQLAGAQKVADREVRLDEQRDKILVAVVDQFIEANNLPPLASRRSLGQLLRQASEGRTMVVDPSLIQEIDEALFARYRKRVEKDLERDLRSRPQLPAPRDLDVQAAVEELDGEVVEEVVPERIVSTNPIFYPDQGRIVQEVTDDDPDRPAGVAIQPRSQNWSARRASYGDGTEFH